MAKNLPPDAGHRIICALTIGNSLGAVTFYQALWSARRLAAGRTSDLPELEATGLLPVQMLWLEQPLSAPATLRVIPPGPFHSACRVVRRNSADQPSC